METGNRVDVQTIQSEKGSFDYALERTRRRTVAIYIDPQKGVVVRAPKRASDREIRGFLLQKTPWILKKLAEVKQRKAETLVHTYMDGDLFLYRGEQFPLRLSEARKNGVDLIDQDIHINLKPGTSTESTPDILRKWYIARARELLNERVLHYSGLLDVAPARISVRGQSKRWGSCSSKGNINLNWKLVMAPPAILDYVVAHELCHLRFPNHRAEFWDLLASIMPDYMERRKWLKQNGHKLVL